MQPEEKTFRIMYVNKANQIVGSELIEARHEHGAWKQAEGRCTTTGFAFELWLDGRRISRPI
jgi:hypothetical protein